MSFGAGAFGEAPFGALPQAGPASATGSAVGNAFTTGTAKLTHAATGSAVGNAFTTGTAKLTMAAIASAVANAATSGLLIRKLDASGSAEGNAFTAGTIIRKLDASGSAEGNAFTAAVAFLRIQAQGDLLAEAFTSGFAEHYINAVNPALGLPTAIFTLTVGGVSVDFTEEFFQIDNLSVGYDGKELSFSEIATPGFGFPTFDPEDSVLLDADLGNGPFRWFTGAIRARETVGQNNNEGFSYVAFGFQRLADEVTLINTTGRPDIEFTVGTTVTSIRSDGTDVTTLFSKSIRTAMQEMFEINAPALAAAGIPSTIGLPGLSQFVGDIPETTRFQNVGFASAVTQLAQLETGVKVFFNDQQQAWSFPNLLLAPTAIVQVNSVNLTELVFDTSTEDRFTAVHLFADADDLIDEAIISKSQVQIGPNFGTIERTEVSLTPKWLTELEVDWTIDKAHQGALATLEDENFWVFRRWSLPDSITPPLAGTPVRLWQKFNFFGNEIWKRTNGVSNFRRREFVSRFPLIHRGNPHVPGDVIGPLEVKMAYFPGGVLGASFTWVSSVNTSGTPTFSTSLIDVSDFPTEVRVPPSGFTGSAFDVFGVQRELIRIVNRTEVTSANANAILRLHKDIVISGDLPIEGDPVETTLNLNRKVLVNHSTLTTGIESTPALLTGYNYRFGKRGENTLNLTTDVAGLIAGTV